MYRINKKCCFKNRNLKKVLLKRFFCEHVNLRAKSELDSAYVPHIVEKLYTNNYFKPPLKNEKPFSMILPPPNVTGTLHLGHALTVTIQDILVRWKQMQGIETMWVPGTDHAGIATQVVVEKRLWNEKKKTRYDFGRPDFLKEVWRWKVEKGDVIGEELRRLGVSMNWEKEMFTMDLQHTKAVEQAFINLFDAGLIYRSDYLVNWSCLLKSAISDIEVEHIEINEPTSIYVPGYDKPIEFGKLYKFAYKFEEPGEDEIVIATTRPETVLGDVAVAVNSDDTRYSRFIGRNLWHPFRHEWIPVISDSFVDPELGTGAVKITPAHDQNDFEAGQRHSLKVLQVIDESGNISSISEEFQGMPRFKVRELIRSRLQDLGLFRGTEDHKMLVPVCSRSRDIVELMVRPQWFIKCEEMASKALEAVKAGKLSIQPKVFENNWNNWLENIRDWCISRQLWWGHQIPAYCCSLKNDPNKHIWVAAKNENEAKLKAIQQIGFEDKCLSIIRDEDVLDTWFSSSLLPFSAFGWPQQTEELSKYYPLSIMETGHDILFFWVARMAMIGKQLTGELPFKTVLLHGIICDTNGRKMSKSLGNIVAPGDVINGISLQGMEQRARESHGTGILSLDELKRSIQGQKMMFPQGIPECGSDALRLTLVAQDIKNHYISFDVNECHTNRLFCNKIWQATKFTKMWFKTVSEKQKISTITDDQLSVMDKWILSRLSKLVNTTNAALQSHDFHIAVTGLKTFLYHDFCDVYLESTKRCLRNSDSCEAAAHCWVLLKCLDIGLRTLAPFMPMLSEHLHKSLPIYGVEMKNIDYPEDLQWVDNELEQNIEETLEIIVALRRLRKIFNLTPKHKPEAYLMTSWPFLEKLSDVIADLAGCHRIYISDTYDEKRLKSCITDSVRGTRILLNIPMEFRNKIEFDIPVMQKKKGKLINELEKLRKMISGKTYSEKATVEAQKEHSNRMMKIQEKINRIEYISKLIES